MAVRMRLRREGKKKEPNYRIVVTDSRSPRDGRFLEDLGFYQPLSEPSAIKLNHDRALEWLRHGAQPSEAVKNLLRIEGVWESFRPGEADAEAGRRRRRAERRAEKAAARQPSAGEASPGEPEEPEAAAGEQPAGAEPSAEPGDTDTDADAGEGGETERTEGSQP